LQLAEFVILTDQKNLTHLSDQRLNTYWQQKVFSKLIGLQYRIVYKKDIENRVVDALSCHPSPPAQLLTLSSNTLVWLTKVQEGYNLDEKAQQMIAALAVNSKAIPHFSLSNGILRYKNRICIGNNSAL
jgi:hypothetical protein